MKRKILLFMSMISLSMTMLCSAAETNTDAFETNQAPEIAAPQVPAAADLSTPQDSEAPAAAEPTAQQDPAAADLITPQAPPAADPATPQTPQDSEVPPAAESTAQQDPAATDLITPQAPESTQGAESVSQDEWTNLTAGCWVEVGMDGRTLNLPGASFHYYFDPDGTIRNSDNSLILSTTFAEDGSFTVDTSGEEGLSEYTVTGQVSPLTQESLEIYKIKTDNQSVDCSEGANQLILTIAYPDPINPLAGSPAVTKVCFLRSSSQASFLHKYLCNKIWKIDDKTLKLDEKGLLDLNDGEYTGKLSVYSLDREDLYIPAEVEFRWNSGGLVKYAAISVTADSVTLQNIKEPGEILVLTYAGKPEKHIPEEAKPFIGVWEIGKVEKNHTEIDPSELLESDSMTAEITEDGDLSLKFSTGFSIVLTPVYTTGSLQVKYNRPGYNMDWTARLEDDGSVTAQYEDYRLVLIRIQ